MWHEKPRPALNYCKYTTREKTSGNVVQDVTKAGSLKKLWRYFGLISAQVFIKAASKIKIAGSQYLQRIKPRKINYTITQKMWGYPPIKYYIAKLLTNTLFKLILIKEHVRYLKNMENIIFLQNSSTYYMPNAFILNKIIVKQFYIPGLIRYGGNWKHS